MILNEITFGQLAECYFPYLTQSAAAERLLEYIDEFNEGIFQRIKRKIKPNGMLDHFSKITDEDIVAIGMYIGFPREQLVQDVRDTITWGYNIAYEIENPLYKRMTYRAFRKLDSRLNPPLEFYDCKEVKEES